MTSEITSLGEAQGAAELLKRAVRDGDSEGAQDVISELQSFVHRFDRLYAGRRFIVYREEDVNGASGTGLIASGIEFPDGMVVMRWQTDVNSTKIFDSVDDLREIHSHGGKTEIRWVDDEP